MESASASVGKPIPRQRRKEARPSELLAAALTLFVEKGFAATRLDDVAARAGVSKGTLYLYFDNKEALFSAVIREGLVPVMNLGASMIEDHQGSCADLLCNLLRAWWQLVGETPLGGIPKVVLAEAQNFPEVADFYFQEVIAPGRAMLISILEKGMAAGEFRRVPVEPTVDSIFAPLMMLTIWRTTKARLPCATHDPAVFVDTHLDLVIKGLRAASGVAS